MSDDKKMNELNDDELEQAAGGTILQRKSGEYLVFQNEEGGWGSNRRKKYIGKYHKSLKEAEAEAERAGVSKTVVKSLY